MIRACNLNFARVNRERRARKLLKGLARIASEEHYDLRLAGARRNLLARLRNETKESASYWARAALVVGMPLTDELIGDVLERLAK